MINILNKKIVTLVILKKLLLIFAQILIGVLLGKLFTGDFSNETKILAFLSVIYLLFSQLLRLKIDNEIKKEKESIMLGYENNFLDKIANDKNQINSFHSLITTYSQKIEQSGLDSFYKIIDLTTTIILSTLIIMFIDFRIALIIFILIGIYYFISRAIKSDVKEKTSANNEIRNNFVNGTLNLIELYSESKSNTKTYLLNKIKNQNDLYRQSNVELAKSSNLLTMKNEIIASLLNLFLSCVVILLVPLKIITLAQMILINSFVHPITTSLLELPATLSEYKKYHATIKDVNNILKKVNHKEEYGSDLQTITVNDKYDFKIGEKYLIRGKSGSGKTMLVKNILEPNVYNLKINGQEIKDMIAPEDIVFIGTSKIILENHTLVENILLGRDKNNYSNLDDLINLFGLEKINQNQTINSDKLSEGEKQRIYILRMIIDTPKVLILDESFNNLDEKNKTRIKKYIYEKVNTIIEIAHTKENEKLYNKIYEINEAIYD